MDLRKRKWQEAGEDCIMRSFKSCRLHGSDGNSYKLLAGKPEGKT
jgi:hypothetical protein